MAPVDGGGPTSSTGCARRSPTEDTEDAGSTPATSTHHCVVSAAVLFATGQRNARLRRLLRERVPSWRLRGARDEEDDRAVGVRVGVGDGGAARRGRAERRRERTARAPADDSRASTPC